MSVQCVDCMLEVIPGPQWMTAFSSIIIQTAGFFEPPLDIKWMEIHSSTYDEKCHLRHCSGSLSREYLLCRVLYRSPCNIAPVLPELCANLFDTALPPHDLYAGVIDTALLPPNQICYMIPSTTDLSRIRDTILAHANLGGICLSTVSTTDLNELVSGRAPETRLGVSDWYRWLCTDVKKTLPTVRDWTTGVEEHCLQLMPNSDTTHTYEVSLQSSAIAMICNYESSKDRMRVFMHSLGVTCNTFPTPPERPSPPLDTLSPAGVTPFDAAPLLLTPCIAPPPHRQSLVFLTQLLLSSLATIFSTLSCESLNHMSGPVAKPLDHVVAPVLGPMWLYAHTP
ncbi:uncharacterized protein UHO2_00355 [Ustilago hordei]|uniref:uncharacterized protein n=1 Tax=Ustilago hordei TaxID=120017 RepID=UPI001A42A25F|nr:uncharacterized protein UHO2_00355 [Ustilago hordei]SYW81850.1 uncharacterized protein UHO2_00355 [Ustilago hordei]